MRSPRPFLVAVIASSSSRRIGDGGIQRASSFSASTTTGMMRPPPPRPLDTTNGRRSARHSRHRGIGGDRHIASSSSNDSSYIDVDTSERKSVTGPIYVMNGGPNVTLYTKLDCSLCDRVKDVLESLRDAYPHSLHAVDITDDDKRDWFSKYKYDIPVLHVNGMYWTKHRLSVEDAIAGLGEASDGRFVARKGEPDAGRLERG